MRALSGLFAGGSTQDKASGDSAPALRSRVNVVGDLQI